ncbi:unnamed protein product [Lathyrus oleraceus]
MLQHSFKTWTSIIRSLCVDSRHNETLSFFHHCLKDSAAFKPDHQVLAAILKSGSALLAANLGKCLHSYVVKQGHVSCHVTGSSKHDVDVIRVFRTMHMSGEAMPNSVTVATLLPVCARSGNLNAGKGVHGYVIKSGFEEDAFAGLAENVAI